MKHRYTILTGVGLAAVAVIVSSASVSASAPSAQAASTSTAVSSSAQAPETPGNFRIVSRTGNQLRLNWDWVAGGVGTLHYEIAYAGRTVVINHYYPGHTQDVSDLNLSPGHSYTFSLWAVDEVGTRSAVPARLVFETTPPTPPSSLVQLSTREGYPDLISFRLSNDNAGVIRAYEAFLNGTSFGIIPGVDNEFSLVDQIFIHAYRNAPRGAATLELRAFDSSFNVSPPSAPLTVVFP